jgi:hypothetical protein
LPPYEQTAGHFWVGVRQSASESRFCDQQPKRQSYKLRDGSRVVIVPNHKELDRGTLKGILDQIGLTVDEFLKLLKS